VGFCKTSPISILQKSGVMLFRVDAMFKYRLLSGTLMAAAFIALVIFDGWLDGSLTASTADDKPVRGTLLMVVVAAIVSLGGIELSRLAAGRDLVVLNPVCAIGLVLLTTAWYWPQLIHLSLGLFVLLTAALVLAGVMLSQYLRYGTEGAMANCGVSCFALMYLGLLGAFLLGVRIDAGPMATLLFILAVKSSDIGAYISGKLLGKHKFSPRVSPGKTWEGMAGGLLAAVVISCVFAGVFGIITVWSALVFGACIAFIGQLSDLSESVLKRDAKQKDSSNRVPGFGGILDVIDSTLFSAPFAYVFFTLAMRQAAG
jgi:phosphatidate cytidylyltransferase